MLGFGIDGYALAKCAVLLHVWESYRVAERGQKQLEEKKSRTQCRLKTITAAAAVAAIYYYYYCYY